MTSVLMPFDGQGDEWRTKAYQWTRRWYARHFPDWKIVVGTCAGEWSKGAALHLAYQRASSGPLVLADADSVLYQPAALQEAVTAVREERASWVQPHFKVYRLNEKETARLHAGADNIRLGLTCRQPYGGLPGGGITVLSRDAWETVRGVDPRFHGWGGEDICFGYALETLVGPALRLEADLVHLWHPHPAPDLRGSLESEALVAEYKAAARIPILMRAVVNHEPRPDLAPLNPPAEFRADRYDRREKIGGTVVRFRDATFETTDPYLADALRHIGGIWEVTPHGIREPA